MIKNKFNTIEFHREQIIIGRNKETFILNNVLNSKDSHLSLITGRRRVGKSFWLDNSIKDFIKKENKDYLYLYFTGVLNNSRKQNLDNFCYILQNFISKEFPSLTIPQSFLNWNDFFETINLIINYLIEDQQLILVFDEVPWLDGEGGYLYKDGFKEIFSFYWNNFYERNSIPIKIFLTGSATTWMIKNIAKDKGGLYGRIKTMIHLKPFNLSENFEYLKYFVNKDISIKESIEYYMTFGGVAYYLSLLKPISYEQNVKDLFQNNILRNEYNELFYSLFKANNVFYPDLFEEECYLADDLIIENKNRHISIHKAIIELLSTTNALTVNEIIEKITKKIKTSKNSIRNAIYDLIQSDFIKENNLLNSKTKNKRFSINDLFSLFYLKWLKNKSIKDFTKNSKSFNIWSGFAFEIVCFNQIDFLLQKIHLKNFSTAYVNFDVKNNDLKKGAQIDLILFNNNINYIVEIKFYENDKFIIGKDEVNNLENKYYRLKEISNKNIEYIFITLQGIKFNYDFSSIINSQNSISIELNKIL